ncbi:RNA-binding S4 domain-containing protein [Eubacterium aggregans]|uniref:RNA-binding S4 domain-containing protein n=1 Tax=Eubacterium aggregans TaxID=81409 RepID=UPI003F2B3056
MRVDKFLKNARLIKRRTVGKAACDGGRITINGKEAKPGSKLKVGDILTIAYGNGEQTVEVLQLLEHAPKDKAEKMYREI